MTPNQIRAFEELRANRESLLGQTRGLTAKVERLEAEAALASSSQTSRENAAFKAGWDDAVETVFRVLGERFTRTTEAPR